MRLYPVKSLSQERAKKGTSFGAALHFFNLALLTCGIEQNAHAKIVSARFHFER